MHRRLLQMLKKEFRQLLRDPRMAIMIFAMPLLQMLVFAFALTTDVTDIKTALVDQDMSPASRELAAAFTSSGYFEVSATPANRDTAEELLDRGKVRVVLEVPHGFASDLAAGCNVSVQALADGTDSNTAAIIFGYASGIIAEFNTNQAAASGIATLTAPVELRHRAWSNANLESKYYFVPGLIAIMLLTITIILTGVAIVREKETGTIEQIMVTPISRLEYILGKCIPFALIGYVIMTLMFFLAMLMFDIHIQGSMLLLYALSGTYIISNLGMALWISVTAHTQQQAVLTSFLILMPMVLLSGYMFPVRNMPEVVQWVTNLNPMRWYIDILRGIVTKGVGIDVLWFPALMLSLLAIGFVSIAVMKFQKTAS